MFNFILAVLMVFVLSILLSNRKGSKLLLAVSLIMLANAVQADWQLDGRTASLPDVNGYGTKASMFIGQGDNVMLGFMVYDTSCKKLSSELHESADHEVNNHEVTFQSQCVGYNQRMYMPARLSGNDLLVDMFERYDSVRVSTVGSNYIFVYEPANFDDAYNGLSAIADLSAYKL